MYIPCGDHCVLSHRNTHLITPSMHIEICMLPIFIITIFFFFLLNVLMHIQCHIDRIAVIILMYRFFTLDMAKLCPKHF